MQGTSLKNYMSKFTCVSDIYTNHAFRFFSNQIYSTRASIQLFSETPALGNIFNLILDFSSFPVLVPFVSWRKSLKRTTQLHRRKRLTTEVSVTGVAALWYESNRCKDKYIMETIWWRQRNLCNLNVSHWNENQLYMRSWVSWFEESLIKFSKKRVLNLTKWWFYTCVPVARCTVGSFCTSSAGIWLTARRQWQLLRFIHLSWSWAVCFWLIVIVQSK